ncbi:MAG: DUF2203 family protein [Chloroflexi bacterium]|nr:DUF2203 family protein [Chloroflexota bacterium]
MARRLFTLDEANALLPTLRPMLMEMVEARKKIVEAEPDLWPVLEKAMGNGGGKKAGAVLPHFEIIQRNVQTITGLGIEIKDIGAGLIDFPAEREGRVVYLCWRLGEASVAHWHELDAGFAGRQPL